MAPLLHRRGRGGFRCVRRLIYGLIIVSFVICMATALVFMFFQNPSLSRPSSSYCDCSFSHFLPISCRFISYNGSVKEMDPEMIEELRKARMTLIKEELHLLKKVTVENMKRYRSLMENTKKASSQFSKEAENCYIGVGTCEEARERAQQKLVEERKLTALWKKRAEMLAKP